MYYAIYHAMTIRRTRQHSLRHGQYGVQKGRVGSSRGMAKFDGWASKWRLTAHIYYAIYYAMTQIENALYRRALANRGCRRVAFELWDGQV